MAQLALPLALQRFPTLWTLRWPEDRDALGSALAVAAAYGDLVGALDFHVWGDVTAAASTVLEDLAAEGISDNDLPEISLALAPTLEAGQSVETFPAALIAACEYERRPGLPVFPDDDPLRTEVWTTAARVLGCSTSGRVTVFAETLAGAEAILVPESVLLVSHSHILRRQARRRGMGASPRPPAPTHVPSGGVVVVDARRPDDVGLVAASGAQIALANCVGRLALIALGVPDAIAGGGHLSGRDRAVTRSA